MRVIGYIEHPHIKISVFKNEDRLFIKFENEKYEQTFKLGADDRFKNLADVQQLVDSAFIEGVSGHLRQMHELKLAALARNFPVADQASLFDVII